MQCVIWDNTNAHIIFSYVMFQFSDVFKLENDLPDVRTAAKVR